MSSGPVRHCPAESGSIPGAAACPHLTAPTRRARATSARAELPATPSRASSVQTSRAVRPSATVSRNCRRSTPPPGGRDRRRGERCIRRPRSGRRGSPRPPRRRPPTAAGVRSRSEPRSGHRTPSATHPRPARPVASTAAAARRYTSPARTCTAPPGRAIGGPTVVTEASGLLAAAARGRRGLSCLPGNARNGTNRRCTEPAPTTTRRRRLTKALTTDQVVFDMAASHGLDPPCRDNRARSIAVAEVVVHGAQNPTSEPGVVGQFGVSGCPPPASSTRKLRDRRTPLAEGREPDHEHNDTERHRR